jgi:SAM-dependent methyltransferase
MAHRDVAVHSRFEACPCCGSQRFSVIWHNRHVQAVTTSQQFMFEGRAFIERVVRCAECGFAFLDPYTDGSVFYAGAGIDEYLSLTAQRRRYFAEVRRLTVERGLDLGETARILDVGAGDGGWLAQWPPTWRKCATEAHPHLIARLAQQGAEVKATPEDHEGEFDLVSAFDFLEHVPDPRSWLTSIVHKVRPGGYLVVGVPDLGKWIARLLGTRYYLYCPMHYGYFSRPALGRLIADVFGHTLALEASPKMYPTLGSVIKWVSGGRAAAPGLRLPLPIGYSASLIALARR